MTQAAVKAKPAQSPVKPAPAYTRNTVADVYVITTMGVVMLTGRDADEVRQKIEADKTHVLDYRFFDYDHKRWAYWAVDDGTGNLQPPAFPSVRGYSMTSLQLYTKAVSYVRVLAHAVGLLKEKPSTLWDRMLKPTTIIMAIVGIVFCMMLGLMALTG
ncbi:hypothetical protein [Candidatus Magnetobacterium casense]|uniref:Uncharacterized protein n=1 Tax=Candidatus Magnetobacterium casense TaxID=1455061 RepID=A0ABS6S1W9_9BACT|nr:hypothetical protein [Candidatus Magnetobacterium casensis]MBV6342852.1 hypothetical protein [Candidatus Magnetobacterium casensis]